MPTRKRKICKHQLNFDSLEFDTNNFAERDGRLHFIVEGNCERCQAYGVFQTSIDLKYVTWIDGEDPADVHPIFQEEHSV